MLFTILIQNVRSLYMKLYFVILFLLSFSILSLFQFLGVHNNIFVLYFYLLYIFSFIFLLVKPHKYSLRLIKKELLKTNKKTFLILGLLSIVYLSLIYYFSTFIFHYQEDEFITAHISFSLPSILNINWFGIYPEDKSWVTQFPILFFFIQKQILNILGPSLNSIRISTWPYQILSVILVYLIAAEYFKKKLYSSISVFIYIFLAPNLYLSSLGLHFISSTVFFLSSFYFYLLMQNRKKIKYSILCGISIGACYLTYASSYIIIPLLIVFTFLQYVKERNKKHIFLFTNSLVIAFLIFYPFLLKILTGNNFLLQRVNQVSIFQSSNVSFMKTLLNSLTYNITSLYTNGLGGVNEYYFGHQSFFNIYTLVIFIIGLIIFILKSFRELKFIYLIIFIFSIFSLGMILTVPPGAFHRIYISLPFISIVIAYGIMLCTESKLLTSKKYVRILLLIIILAAFAISNLISTYSMIKNDKNISILTDSIYIDSIIKKTIPAKSKIYISAYPAYHLGKELVFRTNNLYTIETDYFDTVFTKLKRGDILILQYPDNSQINLLSEKFPKGLYLNKVGSYKFKFHSVFIPK